MSRLIFEFVCVKDPIGNIVDAEFQTYAKDPVKVRMTISLLSTILHSSRM